MGMIDIEAMKAEKARRARKINRDNLWNYFRQDFLEESKDANNFPEILNKYNELMYTYIEDEDITTKSESFKKTKKIIEDTESTWLYVQELIGTKLYGKSQNQAMDPFEIMKRYKGTDKYISGIFRSIAVHIRDGRRF